MRRQLWAAAIGLMTSTHLGASNLSSGPDLPIRFFNVIPDICFQTARGRPLTNENASALLLEPAPDIPPTVKAHFGRVPNWFRLKSEPNSIFVGTGDRPGACHVVLANTTQTAAVQKQVTGFLKLGGFQILSSSAPAAPVTDILFAMEAPDGYMLISLQAPRDTVQGGDGDQGAVHVKLMPKAQFEALAKNRQ